MKTIPLSQGFVALIDDEDFARVSQYKWCALVCKNGRIYAKRHYWVPGGKGKEKNIMMHRFILGLPLGRKPDVDHEDHNGLNNQKHNLRVATRQQNNANQRKTRGTSQFKGVYWNKNAGKWQAQIKVNGVRHYLGLFTSEAKAAGAYAQAAVKYFGTFSYTEAI